MRTDALTPSPAAVCDHERDLDEDEEDEDEDEDEDDAGETRVASAARGVGSDEVAPVEEAAASGNCCEAMCHAL